MISHKTKPNLTLFCAVVADLLYNPEAHPTNDDAIATVVA